MDSGIGMGTIVVVVLALAGLLFCAAAGLAGWSVFKLPTSPNLSRQRALYLGAHLALLVVAPGLTALLAALMGGTRYADLSGLILACGVTGLGLLSSVALSLVTLTRAGRPTG